MAEQMSEDYAKYFIKNNIHKEVENETFDLFTNLKPFSTMNI